MPLVWKIDPANSLVVAVANGDVTRLEVDRYLDALVENDALIYRKVFDVHKGETAMTADDVLPLAVRIRSLHELGPMGPLAVILPTSGKGRLHRALGLVATAKRAMRVFENPLLGYRWIAKQDLPGATKGHDEATDTLEWRAKARNLAARVRHLARTGNEEAHKMRLSLRCDATFPGGGPLPPDEKAGDSLEKDEEVLYPGRADIMHRGVPLNICVSRVGQSWEFQCCHADRAVLRTLLTLSSNEIIALLSEGHDPLESTLNRLKELVQSGSLAIPDVPSGDY
jgi:hypothetical protein